MTQEVITVHTQDEAVQFLSDLENKGPGTYRLKVCGHIDEIYQLTDKLRLLSTSILIDLDLSSTNGVTSIGDYTFSDCESLTSVSIPEGVTSIGAWAFGNCTSLTSVSIPASVTSIEAGAFD
ncbi:MAG: leucine-rich repeat domain-containing protein, partial [Treponema sp.]|nr:leucine-rich repeat domain-containing protein [Treponema sp.]